MEEIKVPSLPLVSPVNDDGHYGGILTVSYILSPNAVVRPQCQCYPNVISNQPFHYENKKQGKNCTLIHTSARF